jgi:hypothetical protein
MPKGIREMTRVARRSGAVLLHAYGDPHQIDFLGFLVHALQTVRPAFDGPPMDPPPFEFQLADPRRLHRELAAAGLKNIRVETITETTEFESGGDLWDWIVSSNPIVECLLDPLKLTRDETAAARQALETMVRDRAGGRGTARLTNPVNIGIGTK